MLAGHPMTAPAFDPSRFIQAEAERAAQTVATLAACPVTVADFAFGSETTEISRFSDEPEPALATIATIAAPQFEIHYPFDPDLVVFIAQPCPPGVRPEAWDEITGETDAVRQRWTDHAIGLGWTSLDLFGCHPNPFGRRVDRDGLVASITGLLTPVRITSITATYAELTPFQGPPMRYHRLHRPGQVHLWEAYSMAGGP